MARLELKTRKQDKTKPTVLKLKLAKCEEKVNMLKRKVEIMSEEMEILKTINKEKMRESDDLNKSVKTYKVCVLDILNSQGSYYFNKLYEHFGNQHFEKIRDYFAELYKVKNEFYL